ncbi:MAG: hypothetical protein E7253_04495 [Lachnospiraceae bacterium]|nr:hypothetical protein [Lachnospiraceae bacterium]
MNPHKLEQYNLTGSIHTLAVKSEGIVEDIMEEVADCIISNSQTKQGTTTTSIINPNKLIGEIYTYSEFDTALNTILAGAGIEDYTIVRADMRFDSYDAEHYEKFSKLNRYLVSLMAVTYKFKNAYRTTNLFTQKQLSVAIKNQYMELENYDKKAESDGNAEAYSRLEERSKRWQDKDLAYEFLDRWFARWDKAIKNIPKVHKAYNDSLEKIWNEGKNAYPCKFRSLTDFLIQYQNCIFCKAQMIDLLSRFEEVGKEKAKSRAENHKKRYGIEYFSQKDVERAINEIKRATLEFFSH